MNHKRHKGQDKERAKKLIEKFESRWIVDRIDRDAVEFSKEMGKELKRQGLTTSQFRNIFSELKRIQLKGFDKEKTAFLLLKPKVAYAAARTKHHVFRDLFFKAWEEVKEEKHFKNFMDLMEAILAFHK